MDEVAPETARDTIAFLGGEYVTTLQCGTTIYCTCLPGDTVSAAAHMPDGLHVFLDLNKPDAVRHARRMLQEWLNLDLTETPAGLVELVPV